MNTETNQEQASGGERPSFDLLCVGLSFLDLTLSLPDIGPQRGTEIWTQSWGFGPGGVANFAFTAARLGARTTLATVVEDGRLGALFVDHCADAGIDVSGCVPAPGWHQPVTAALTWGGDRALVTGGSAPTIDLDHQLRNALPDASAAITHLDESARWIHAARLQGTKVIGQVGWDTTGRWNLDGITGLDDCWAISPNEDEARRYTGLTDPTRAARALADRVGVAVVTLGAQGCVGADAATGQVITVAPLEVDVIDATGAGDMFGAAFAYAAGRGCSLSGALALATTVSGLGVTRPGGATTAPQLDEVLARIRHTDHLAPAFDELTELLGNPTSQTPPASAQALTHSISTH